MPRRSETRKYAWADVQDVYRTLPDTKLPATAREMDGLRSDWEYSATDGHPFYEMSRETVLRKLDEGHDLPDVESPPDVPADTFEGVGRVWRWNDSEGDYEHELWLAGEAECYLDRRLERGRPGLYVHAEVSFGGGTSPKVISEYGQWVGAAIQAIQSAGFDTSLSVTSTVDALFNDPNLRTSTAIQVNDFGEELVARDYGILFTAAGYRHLIFCAKMIPELRDGLTGRSGLGICVHGHGWNVDYDPDDRVLTFGCASTGMGTNAFPADEMSAMLADVGEHFYE
jgi:hypothetical protein